MNHVYYWNNSHGKTMMRLNGEKKMDKFALTRAHK
jgi:hypothetical protein